MSFSNRIFILKKFVIIFFYFKIFYYDILLRYLFSCWRLIFKNLLLSFYLFSLFLFKNVRQELNQTI